LIFLDTTILVSAVDRSDSLHDDGRAVLKAVGEERSFRAVTTDYVLDETFTLLRKRGTTTSVISEVIGRFLISRNITVVFVDKPLFEDSLASFRKYERLSFTDAVSLTVMKKLRIREIYSHDSDFDLNGIVRKERLQY